MKSANPGTSIDFVLNNTVPQNLNINLYNSEGQMVKNIFTGLADTNQNISSDVSTLSAGIYLVRINGNRMQKTLKYVVVK